MKPRRSPFFTLIEMLMVLTVLLTLIALLLPVLSRGRAAAQQTVCMSNLRQIYMAANTWRQDHQGARFTAPGWLPKTIPHVGDRRIYICPADPDPVVAGPEAYVIDINAEAFDLTFSAGPHALVEHPDETTWIYRFEDRYGAGGCDWDYNDLVFEVKLLPDGKLDIRCIGRDQAYECWLIDVETRQSPNGWEVIQPGFHLTCDAGRTSYGFNMQAANVWGDANKVLIMDYCDAIADPYATAWNSPDYPWYAVNDVPIFARHTSAMNVLWGDGRVTRTQPGEVDPGYSAVRDRFWLE